ncbi:MAG TPA: DedA family protein [Solirubrobacteraceae bacterium]|nr:DedA family protein [Solirubrobacteraceae bacterium]
MTEALIGGGALNGLLRDWGYAIVLLFTGAQSLGLPLPGTTALISGALYAAATHRLTLPGVILAALSGALAGSALGYGAGRWFGGALLERHGYRWRLPPARLERVRMMVVHGGLQIVFFGRFISGLRNAVAVLAGASRMPPGRFAAACGAAAVLWSVGNGCAYYFAGRAIAHAGTAVQVGLGTLLVLSLLATGLFVRRGARRLWRSVDGADGT